LAVSKRFYPDANRSVNIKAVHNIAGFPAKKNTKGKLHA
jgi:hypothetical protein